MQQCLGDLQDIVSKLFWCDIKFLRYFHGERRNFVLVWCEQTEGLRLVDSQPSSGDWPDVPPHLPPGSVRADHQSIHRPQLVRSLWCGRRLCSCRRWVESLDTNLHILRFCTHITPKQWTLTPCSSGHFCYELKIRISYFLPHSPGFPHYNISLFLSGTFLYITVSGFLSIFFRIIQLINFYTLRANIERKKDFFNKTSSWMFQW